MNQKKTFQYMLAVLCVIAACHVSRKAKESMPVSFDIQGHRGARGLMPENSFPAMKTALDLGVTTLEMDVVITADKQVILSHEPWMGHEITTKPGGSYVGQQEERALNIYRMDFEEVKKYDVGMKPHTRFPNQKKIPVYKPLLSEIIDSVQSYMMTGKRPFPYYNIETKTTPAGDGIYHPEPATFVNLLMDVINDRGIADRVIIQSFDIRTLQYLHHKFPNIKTALLIEAFDRRELEIQLAALGFTPTIYSPAYQLIDEKLIKDCHDRNMKIIPWTVNDLETINRLRGLGVDGIITDYPNLLL